MMKTVIYITVAEFKSVEKTSDMEYEKWKWRERYIRFQGELYILESERRFAGQQYLYFTDHSGNWLTTGYGEYRINGKRLIMTTKNSVYEFEIIYE